MNCTNCGIELDLEALMNLLRDAVRAELEAARVKPPAVRLVPPDGRKHWSPAALEKRSRALRAAAWTCPTCRRGQLGKAHACRYWKNGTGLPVV